MVPRFVNKGLRAPAHCPNDPQAYLHRTNHPYAPFTGNAMTWESYVWDDGSTYEGLCREDVPHGLGVFYVGNGMFPSVNHSVKGDVYEGEFYAGFPHGLGQYFARDTNEIYRGEYYAGKKQGCGMVLNYTPFKKLVEKGIDTTEAWKKTKSKIHETAKYGTWRKDTYVAEPDERGDRYCHIAEIKGTLQEVETVITKARMFTWKPDGEVTFHYAQDANGLPVNLLQDPLHYPYGTMFLAPGPAGQCDDVPKDNPTLRKQMMTHAANYQRIHDMYNLDYDPPPGSNLYKALELDAKRAKEEAAYWAAEENKTASARAQEKPPKKPMPPLASVTMGLAKEVGNAFQDFGNRVAGMYKGPHLARPIRRHSKRR